MSDAPIVDGGITRRSLIGRIGAAVIGLALARTLPGIVPDVPTLARPTEITDTRTGISIRFVRQFDASAPRYRNRLDVWWVDCELNGATE